MEIRAVDPACVGDKVEDKEEEKEEQELISVDVVLIAL